MIADTLPPFDDALYLERLETIEAHTDAECPFREELLRGFLHQSRQLMTEAIRLRMVAGLAQSRVTLLEQGQQLLPLTTTDNPPKL